MIKGIDTQVMLQHTLEQARQVSEQLRTSATSQDFLRKLDQQRTIENANKVLAKDKAEHGRVEEKKEREKGQQTGSGSTDTPAKQTRPIQDDPAKLDFGYKTLNRIDFEV